MKFMTWTCALLLSLPGVAAAQSRVLYDVRVPTPAPQLQEKVWQQIRALARRADQAQLWGRDASCVDQDLTINGAAAGAFTAPNTRQTAYLYTSCFEIPNVSRQGLVIMQGQQVVAHYVFKDHFTELYSLKDINRNGSSELGLLRHLEGQGTAYDYLAVAELRPSRRFLMLEKVNYNDCGNMGTTGWTSQVIRVLPGTRPTFTKQSLSGRCDGVDPFRRISAQGVSKAFTPQQEPTEWKTAPLR